MNKAYMSLVEQVQLWYTDFVSNLPRILLALVVILLTVLFSRLVYTLTYRGVSKFVKSQAVIRLSAFGATVLVITTGLFMSLAVLDLDQAVTSLLAGAGVVGLILGLAFQEPITNVMSGVIVAFRKTYGVQDLIKTNGYLGRVKDLSLRDTTLITLDGLEVTIPNKMVVQNVLVNYSREDERRVDIDCGIAYNSDLTLVKTVATYAIRELQCVSKEKPVQFIYTGFDSSSINFQIRYWVHNNRMIDYLEAKSKGVEAIMRAFSHEEIEIPFPRRRLDVHVGDEVKQLADYFN